MQENATAYAEWGKWHWRNVPQGCVYHPGGACGPRTGGAGVCRSGLWCDRWGNCRTQQDGMNTHWGYTNNMGGICD